MKQEINFKKVLNDAKKKRREVTVVLCDGRCLCGEVVIVGNISTVICEPASKARRFRELLRNSETFRNQAQSARCLGDRLRVMGYTRMSLIAAREANRTLHQLQFTGFCPDNEMVGLSC